MEWIDDRPVTVARSYPAGLLSLALHALAFLLLALIVQPAGPALLSEPERAVQIVMARNETRSRDQYEDQAEAVQESKSAAETIQRERDSSSEPVPTRAQTQQLISSEFALPANPATGGALTVLPGPQPSGARRGDGRIPIAGNVDAFLADERARLTASRPAGDPTAVSVFGGPPATGRSFVFLIDRSKSMGHGGLNALEAAEAELLSAVRNLRPEHKFQVVAYHHECAYLNRRELLPATEESKQLVRGFLSGLAAFGATEHEMALQSALSHKPDVIYLLTDGGDPQLSGGQLRAISKLAGGKTSIHCVQFGLGPAVSEENFLKQLASLNRGGYVYVDMSRGR